MLKNIFQYLAGTSLTSIITFFLLPVYTSHLSAEEYGYYDLTLSILTVLIPLIWLEIWNGIFRFMYDKEQKEEKLNELSKGFTLYLISLAFYIIIALNLIIFSSIRYIELISIYGIVLSFQNLLSFSARALEERQIFIISGIVGALIVGSSNLILILVFGIRLPSLYISAIVGSAVQIFLLGLKTNVYKHLKIQEITKEYIFSTFKYLLPLSIGSILFFFIMSFNRLLMNKILGIEANGIYAIAFKFSTIINILAIAFNYSWQELIFHEHDKSKMIVIVTNASQKLIKFLFLSFGIIVLLIYFAFPLLIDKSFHKSFDLVPFCILSSLLSILGNFYTQIAGAVKKTEIVLYSTIIITIINVSLINFFLKNFGANGLNLVLILSFTINIFIRIYHLKKHLHIKIDISKSLIYAFVGLTALWVYFVKSNSLSVSYFCLLIIIFYFSFKGEVSSLLLTLKSNT